MFLGLSIPELLLILLIIALVFGPTVFSRLGKSLKATRDGFMDATGDDVAASDSKEDEA